MEERSSNITGTRALSEADELKRLRFRHAMIGRLAKAADVESALRAGVREAVEYFDAAAACVVVLDRSAGGVSTLFSLPRTAPWDMKVILGYALRQKVPAPADTIMARLKRRGRDWGVIGLRARRGAFEWSARDALVEAAGVLNDALERIDRDRTTEVRERINRKIMERLRPKDLFYQILDGLRSLTGYDHSSSLLIASEGESAFTVMAEQIAWRKGGSNRIGLSLPVDEALQGLFKAGIVHGFAREGETWKAWTEGSAAGLAGLLDYNRDDADSPRESAILCAPLATREGVLALVKVAATRPDELGPQEAELLKTLLPQASVAVQNLQRTAALEERVIQADRKHAMADLARSVAHDLNNAMGGVLPVLQQVRVDLEAGELELKQLGRDLEQIERSVQWSRRILGGMLAFAKSSLRTGGHAEVAPAVQRASDMLRGGMEGRGIELAVTLKPGLPRPRVAQTELDQILFNLLSNARDATPRGGRVELSAMDADGAVELVVTDTGSGIPPEHLAKIQEPFFTTKPGGNGLGLSICRSIVWSAGGLLQFESEVGRGTRARVVLPAGDGDEATGGPA